ncbi:hypothetical protein L195_g017431, partial [Trifolium pratense]
RCRASGVGTSTPINNALESKHVLCVRCMHVKTDLLNPIRYAWSSECEGVADGLQDVMPARSMISEDKYLIQIEHCKLSSQLQCCQPRLDEMHPKIGAHSYYYMGFEGVNM